MLEANDHCSDNGKNIIDTAQQKAVINHYCIFYQENHVDKKQKMIDDRVLNGGLLKSNGTPQATEEDPGNS